MVLFGIDPNSFDYDRLIVGFAFLAIADTNVAIIVIAIIVMVACRVVYRPFVGFPRFLAGDGFAGFLGYGDDYK